MSDSWRKPLSIVGELILFAGLATSWLPHPTEWNTAIPQGREGVATVPLFNAWTIIWNARQAREGWPNYWRAPIFHPAPSTFALCEAQPLTALLAPLEASYGTACAYNVYLGCMLTLNGWLACRWLAALGVGLPARLAGGLLVQTLPFVHWQFGVLQLVPVWGILWTWIAVWNYCVSPNWRSALTAGLAFGLTYWLCNYYGLFLSILIVAAAPVLLMFRPLTWRLPLHILAAALVAGLLIGPIVRMQLQADRQLNLTRQLITLQQLSAKPRDLARAPVARLPAISLSQLYRDGQRLSWVQGMGALGYLLALIGAVFGCLDRRWRRATLLLLLISVLAGLLACGPDGIGSVRPYAWLMDWYPGLSKVRSPFRFMVFLQLGIASLAAIGLDRCLPARDASRASWQRRLQLSLVGMIAAAALYETWPSRSPACRTPDLARHADWSQWLAANTEQNTPIACLPFSTGTSVADHLDDVIWMHLHSQHQRPMCNGYAAYFPQTYRNLRDALETFPDPSSLSALSALGVSTCVIRRDFWNAEQGEPSAQAAHAGLHRLVADETAAVDIWQLPPAVPASDSVKAPSAPVPPL